MAVEPISTSLEPDRRLNTALETVLQPWKVCGSICQRTDACWRLLFCTLINAAHAPQLPYPFESFLLFGGSEESRRLETSRLKAPGRCSSIIYGLQATRMSDICFSPEPFEIPSYYCGRSSRPKKEKFTHLLWTDGPRKSQNRYC